MNWKMIESLDGLDIALAESKDKAIVLFKHSTRCSVSLMAKRSLEMNWDLDEELIQPYFLDLIQHRDISNEIAKQLEVSHESPQLIGIKNKEVFYHASHSVISVDSLRSAL